MDLSTVMATVKMTYSLIASPDVTERTA